MYRVELSVADNIGDTVFVAFDLDMTRLTSIPAAEAAQIIVGVGVNIVWKLRFLSLSLTLLGRPSLSSLN